MAGLGAFIEGAMDGYAFVEGVQDRKERRQRAGERHEWERENQEWTQTSRQRQRSEWEREDRERSVLSAIGRDAVESYGQGDVSESAPAATQTGGQFDAPLVLSTRNDPNYRPPDEAMQGRGVAVVANEAMAAQDEPVATNKPMIREAERSPAPRSPRPRSLGANVRDMAPEKSDAAPATAAPHLRAIAMNLGLPENAVSAAEAADVAAAEAETGRNATSGARLSRDEIIQRVELVEQAERQLRVLIQQAQPYEKSPAPQRTLPYERQAGLQDTLDSFRDKFANLRHKLTPSTQQRADFGPVPADALRDRATTNFEMMNHPEAADAPAVPKPGQARAEVQAPVRVQAPTLPSAPTADTSPATQRVAEAEAKISAPPDQGGAPSIQAAAETAPAPSARRVVGRGAPVKATEAQRDRAARSFLDHYAETAVPKIVEYYASQGNIEKAQAFETWAKDRNTEQLLTTYGKAVHSIAMGDEEGGKAFLRDYYNQVDDGYEMVDLDLTDPDENGNATKAVVKLRNQQTGEVFTQEFEDRADLITNGLAAVSPERMFETVFDEIAKAAEISAEQRKFERQITLEHVKQGIKAPADGAKLIASAKKALAETYFANPHPAFGKNWTQMSEEEQGQAAIAYVQANRQQGAQLDMPAPPPLYTGE